MACVTCHMTRVTCHISLDFFLQIGGASQWMVCYPRGLPRLVEKGLAFQPLTQTCYLIHFTKKTKVPGLSNGNIFFCEKIYNDICPYEY